MNEGNNIQDAEYSHIVKVELTPEIIDRDYIDINQVAQLLGNVSTKTAKKYIDEASVEHGFVPKLIKHLSNGTIKHIFLKEDIISIAKLMSKDKTHLVKVQVPITEQNFRPNDSSEGSTETNSQRLPTLPSASKPENTNSNELAVSVKSQMLDTMNSVAELKSNFKEFSGNIRELNDNVRNMNLMMQNTISKVVEQGIDLKERYLEDRIKRTEIERIQTDNAAKQAEALIELAKQTELINITINNQKSVPAEKAPVTLIVTAVLVTAIAGGGVGLWFFNASQKKLETQFEERLIRERELQKSQINDILRITREEFQRISVPVNVPMNAARGTEGNQ